MLKPFLCNLSVGLFSFIKLIMKYNYFLGLSNRGSPIKSRSGINYKQRYFIKDVFLKNQNLNKICLYISAGVKTNSPLYTSSQNMIQNQMNALNGPSPSSFFAQQNQINALNAGLGLGVQPHLKNNQNNQLPGS